MSVQQNLSAVAGNDLVWHVKITLNGEPMDLTACAPKIVLKAAAAATDGSGTTFGIGTGLTYTFQTFGMLDWVIPRAQTVPAGTLWYRVDPDPGSSIVSAVYGTLTLIAA